MCSLEEMYWLLEVPPTKLQHFDITDITEKAQNILSEVDYESSRTDEQNLENGVSFFFQFTFLLDTS